jgi:hypothetical protein
VIDFHGIWQCTRLFTAMLFFAFGVAITSTAAVFPVD